MKEAYCVLHDGKEFVTMNYQTFKENQDISVVHFIGTYAECEEFINRSNAAQELIDSANREHEDVDVTEVAKRLADLYNIEYVNLYTREEVYLVAQRSVHAAISNILSKDNPKPISEIINSEIDTVKLF